MPEPGAVPIATLDDYSARFRNLHVNWRGKGVASPHKPCMLLAVLELAERGALNRNEIPYEATLESFAAYFEAIRRDGDHCLAYLPFLRLQRDGFWHLHARPGRTVHDAPRSHSAISESFDHAALDSDLHGFFLDPGARRELRAALLDWFPERREALRALIDSRRISNEYESAFGTSRNGDRSRFRRTTQPATRLFAGWFSKPTTTAARPAAGA